MEVMNKYKAEEVLGQGALDIRLRSYWGSFVSRNSPSQSAAFGMYLRALTLSGTLLSLAFQPRTRIFGASSLAQGREDCSSSQHGQITVLLRVAVMQKCFQVCLRDESTSSRFRSRKLSVR